MASFGEIEPGLTSREEARRHDAADLYGLSGQDLDDFVADKGNEENASEISLSEFKLPPNIILGED